MEPINWHSFFFLLSALVACVASVAVVVSTNVVRMAVYLIVALTASSGLFFLAGAEFVGAMQLVIYVGGTLVLLIFGVMLTAQGPFINMRSRGSDWMMAAIVGGCLLALLLQTVTAVKAWREPNSAQLAAGYEQYRPEVTATEIGEAFVGVRVDKLRREDSPVAAGMVGYLFPFEIVSVHLLVVLIGAAYLARTKKRRQAETA